MPRSSQSGTTGLYKPHTAACRARRTGRTARLTACKCPWFGRYKGESVQLARWAGKALDPHELGPARLVLTRMVAAIDVKAFDAAGEHKTRTSGQTFKEYIEAWWIDYVLVQKLAGAGGSLKDVCGVLKRSPLGHTALHDLTTDQIEEWLNTSRRTRKWGKKQYNEYHALIQRLLDRAVVRRQIPFNPARAVQRLKGSGTHRGEINHFRLDEDIEEKLFGACAQLNRTQSSVNPMSKLTQAKADAIRARAAKPGTRQTDLAAEYKVSLSVVNDIVHGRIWNPAGKRTTTKGAEMERRLIGVFDMGLRSGEMQLIQMKHVDWAHPAKLIDAASKKPYNGYDIILPPEMTKTGKVTGATQIVYAYTLRASRMLEARRFQLNKQADAYIFGTERHGYRVRSFRASWRSLFTAAGLDWGRAKGLTWHTTRHEFGSRVNENEKDIKLAQELLRHADLKTTQRYVHARRDRVRDAAARLNR